MGEEVYRAGVEGEAIDSSGEMIAGVDGYVATTEV